MALLKDRFDDGEYIPTFLGDAYRHFGELQKEFGKKVLVRLYRRPLSYSFYGFEREAILALYPNSRIRKPVPTMLVKDGEESWTFFQNDLSELRNESQVVSALGLGRLRLLARPELL